MKSIKKRLGFRPGLIYKIPPKSPWYIVRLNPEDIHAHANNKVYAWGNFTQPVAAEYPLLASNAVVFTANNEWLSNSDSKLMTIGANAAAEWEISLQFSLHTLGVNQTFIGWTKSGDNNPFFNIGVSTNNRLRLQRRSNTTNTITVDVANPILSANTQYALTIANSNKNANIWLNGILVDINRDVYGTLGDLSLDRISIGTRLLNVPSQPVIGNISRIWMEVK